LTGSGQVPLDGPPVVPGSARSQALIGVVAPAGSTSPVSATKSSHGRDPTGAASAAAVEPPEPHSYWGRVVQTLEFWN